MLLEYWDSRELARAPCVVGFMIFGTGVDTEVCNDGSEEELMKAAGTVILELVRHSS